jgi:DNA-binding IclR family transcriptional regulator
VYRAIDLKLSRPVAVKLLLEGAGDDTDRARFPGLLVEGSWGMAATVFDHQGAPVGALSITGVEQRFRHGRQPELGALLRRAAHELTKRLVDQRISQ